MESRRTAGGARPAFTPVERLSVIVLAPLLWAALFPVLGSVDWTRLRQEADADS